MTETTTRPPLPDRLATNPASPHHVAAVFEFPIGIRFNGRERTDVAAVGLAGDGVGAALVARARPRPL